MGHRQQRSQLGAQPFIHGAHNQIYYNESLRDHKHMSLPYLNDNKSRQTQMSNQSNSKLNSGPNRAPITMMGGAGDEQRPLEPRPISNPSQVRNRNADPSAVSRRSNGPQPQFSVEHSDVINRMNSDGSTVSEIHHHVHHHYNHTHIHHHHNDASTSGQASPFIAGGAAVPSAGASSHNVSHAVANSHQQLHGNVAQTQPPSHEKAGVYRDD